MTNQTDGTPLPYVSTQSEMFTKLSSSTEPGKGSISLFWNEGQHQQNETVWLRVWLHCPEKMMRKKHILRPCAIQSTTFLSKPLTKICFVLQMDWTTSFWSKGARLSQKRCRRKTHQGSTLIFSICASLIHLPQEAHQWPSHPTHYQTVHQTQHHLLCQCNRSNASHTNFQWRPSNLYLHEPCWFTLSIWMLSRLSGNRIERIHVVPKENRRDSDIPSPPEPPLPHNRRLD